MAGATANALSMHAGGNGSAAQAGAMGSSGGTTTGTLACSSCCAPQGRFLVSWFGGYGYTGLCPGAVDNSVPVQVYATSVATFNAPYTALQFCVPSTQSWEFFGASDFWPGSEVRLFPTFPACSVISPPATQTGVNYSVGSAIWLDADGSSLGIRLFPCVCDSSFSLPLGEFCLAFGDPVSVQVAPWPVTVVSCSPPVFSVAVDVYKVNQYIYSYFAPVLVGSAVITFTF